ncbi:MAG TPA: STAS domain-containing protein [Clostridiaceae bacterium]|jgi:anti-sigma B factor antagonist|nr:STAS domain-containing protein [Clostridiaceae bacterium]
MFELCTESNDGKNVIISVKGEIDIYSAPDFKESLYQSINDVQQTIILDCSDLTYIDSMGLGILVGALKRVRQKDHNIIIRNPRSTVRKLFRITGLDKAFIIEEV